MIKGILFDLDGTLLYTLKDLHNAINYALKKNNLQEISMEMTRQFIGNGIEKLVYRAIEDKEKFDVVLDDFKFYYGLHGSENTKPYDGIEKLLESLTNLDIKIGVVSNKYQEGVDKICRPLFSKYTNIFIGARKNINIKPASDMVNIALNMMNLNNNECLFVGDSTVDIQTAKNSNMKSIGVLWGYKDVSDATFTVNNPSEIINIILKENENE